MIRLITLNCWKDEGDWSARVAAIADGLTELNPDIVCLQEVYTSDGRNTGDILSGRTGLICTQVTARTKARGGILSSSGVAILSRQPPVASEAIHLPTTPADGGRKALIATFKTAEGSFRVATLHLSHLRDTEAGLLRGAQLSCLIDHATANWPGPVVFAGDFNAAWHTAELAMLHGPGWISKAPALTGQSSLIDRPAALVDHINLYVPPSNAAKWVLSGAALVLNQPSASGVLPSDHAGLIAHFSTQEYPDKSATCVSTAGMPSRG